MYELSGGASVHVQGGGEVGGEVGVEVWVEVWVGVGLKGALG